MHVPGQLPPGSVEEHATQHWQGYLQRSQAETHHRIQVPAWRQMLLSAHFEAQADIKVMWHGRIAKTAVCMVMNAWQKVISSMQDPNLGLRNSHDQCPALL